jgi:hypothetical protein
MLDPIQKKTIARFVHTLAAVDRSYWEYNSNELTTMGPMSIVAGFQILPPMATQGASDHTIPEGDSTLEFPWVPGLGSWCPVAPIQVTADRRSATSMDPLAAAAWSEEIEVKVPQPEAGHS